MKSIRKSVIERGHSVDVSTFMVLFAFALVAFSPAARADCQDGCDGTNTFLGEDALGSLNGGGGNTANGALALVSNTTGNNNTANGLLALSDNTSGDSNTAIGVSALTNNITASNNTATGLHALYSNTTGTQNTANGAFALSDNTGNYNTATGFSALTNNTTGNSNTANGVNSLYSNTTGGLNTATGDRALVSNTTGNYNTANGGGTLSGNTTGNYNTAQGVNALYYNTTGSQNTANGLGALNRNTTGSGNTAQGVNALYYNTTGASNIALGVSAGADLTTGSNNVDIANRGLAAESGRIRIGTKGKQISTYIAGISGVTIPGGVGVIIDTNGHLGTVTSSKRFKEEIKLMDKASETIYALEPVTFHYKGELDPKGIPQFGLIAEQVENVNPDLVARDEEGKAYTVRYEAVNAMLLNEFLKEHRKVEEQGHRLQKQEATMARQEKEFRSIVEQQQREIRVLNASMKEQVSQIQRVSDQLALKKSSLQLVVNR